MQKESGKGNSLSLTTPELNDIDALFPAEGWFLYWKTSASLWQTKLEQHHKSAQIYVPINWAFHSEDGQQIDFGEQRPETDLSRLYQIALDLGKDVYFFLPLSPVPFMVNGGIPSLLARVPAVSMENLALAFLDNENKVNRFYSFFDTRIFQGFRKFVWQLGQYFSFQGLNVDIIGMYGGVINRSEDRINYISYIEDSSEVFNSSFSRYLSKQEKQNFASIEEERKAKFEYHLMIRELYLQIAQESIQANWGGLVEFSFLGGNPTDIFKRSTLSWEHPIEYVEALEQSLAHDKVPTGLLLSRDVKSDGLNHFLEKVVNHSFVMGKLESFYDDDVGVYYSPLKFFDIFQQNMRYQNPSFSWRELGLDNYLEKDFSGLFVVHESMNILRESDRYTEKVQFFLSEDMSDEEFNNVLKAFLNGLQVVFDTSMLNEEQQRRLHVFVIENNLEVEQIKFMTDIQLASLGQGRLLTFSGKQLLSATEPDKMKFWQKIISLFEIKKLQIEKDSGVVYYLSKRSPQNSELSFEEIRRLTIFNPTSYKRNVKVEVGQNFKFYKIVDEFNTNVQTTSGQVNISLSPDGCVSLDFGYFEV